MPSFLQLCCRLVFQCPEKFVLVFPAPNMNLPSLSWQRCFPFQNLLPLDANGQRKVIGGACRAFGQLCSPRRSANVYLATSKEIRYELASSMIPCSRQFFRMPNSMLMPSRTFCKGAELQFQHAVTDSALKLLKAKIHRISQKDHIS